MPELSQREIDAYGLRPIQALDRCGGVELLDASWETLRGHLYEGLMICFARTSYLHDWQKRPGHVVADYFSIEDLVGGVLKGPDGLFLYDAVFLDVGPTGNALARPLEPTLTTSRISKDVGGAEPTYPWDEAMDVLMVERLSGKGHFETKAELVGALTEKVFSLRRAWPSEGAASRHLRKYWPELYRASGRSTLSDRSR